MSLLIYPLMQLSKKENFRWGSKAKDVFQHLKEAMIFLLMLGLSNFNESFEIELDTSRWVLG